jgi:very-short-patch-repair endonuclease
MNERMNPVEFARLRRQMADEFERQMWQLLRNRQRCNQKFRREHPLGIYTADFYCVAANLVIEVDGDSHLTEEARQNDRVRDQWMKKQGIRILRFSCTEVERETQRILKMIDQALMENP